jgi:hypothetical protein
MNNNLVSNGRVDILAPIGTPLNFADKIPIKHPVTFGDALNGNWIDTPLSLTFFSGENIKIIQNAIKRGVYDKSNQKFTIGEQSVEELQIIMRSIYLQNAENSSVNITAQIVKLNDIVIKYSIEQIYCEAISYIKYKRDSSTMYTIMNYPCNTSNKNNTLEQKKMM